MVVCRLVGRRGLRAGLRLPVRTTPPDSMLALFDLDDTLVERTTALGRSAREFVTARGGGWANQAARRSRGQDPTATTRATVFSISRQWVRSWRAKRST